MCNSLLYIGCSLKVISTTSMGYENIDINALKRRKIKLGNSTLATVQLVAELTIGLLIATARNLLDANAQMKSLVIIISLLLLFSLFRYLHHFVRFNETLSF